MTDPIDNTQMLVAIHTIVATGQEIVDKLRKDATPETRGTVDLVCKFIETQSSVLKQLCEHNSFLIDQLDELSQKIETLNS